MVMLDDGLQLSETLAPTLDKLIHLKCYQCEKHSAECGGNKHGKLGIMDKQNIRGDIPAKEEFFFLLTWALKLECQLRSRGP